MQRTFEPLVIARPPQCLPVPRAIPPSGPRPRAPPPRAGEGARRPCERPGASAGARPRSRPPRVRERANRRRGLRGRSRGRRPFRPEPEGCLPPLPPTWRLAGGTKLRLRPEPRKRCRPHDRADARLRRPAERGRLVRLNHRGPSVPPRAGSSRSRESRSRCRACAAAPWPRFTVSSPRSSCVPAESSFIAWLDAVAPSGSGSNSARLPTRSQATSRTVPALVSSPPGKRSSISGVRSAAGSKHREGRAVLTVPRDEVAGCGELLPHPSHRPHPPLAVDLAGREEDEVGGLVRPREASLGLDEMGEQHGELPTPPPVHRPVEVQAVGAVAGERRDEPGAPVDEAGVVAGDREHLGGAVPAGDGGDVRVFGGDLLYRDRSLGGGDVYADPGHAPGGPGSGDGGLRSALPSRRSWAVGAFAFPPPCRGSNSRATFTAGRSRSKARPLPARAGHPPPSRAGW